MSLLVLCLDNPIMNFLCHGYMLTSMLSLNDTYAMQGCLDVVKPSEPLDPIEQKQA